MSLKKNNAGSSVSYVSTSSNGGHIAPLGASVWGVDSLPVTNGLVPVESHGITISGPTVSQLPLYPSKGVPWGEVPSKSSAALYTTYTSVQDIEYTPEKALNEGLGMVKAIKKSIKQLELGSKMRTDVWMRGVAHLESQGAPTTLIAVCGATGSGKSSLLNAILDDNIVPTSGMRACTAVVTEIAYHDKPTIDADVSFLSLEEWKEELEVLLKDLNDEDGNLKRTTDLRSEAGMAWDKVHAVYPSIGQKQLVMMTADQIISGDPTVSACLGTTHHIRRKDSKAFTTTISKFIDSKDQKRDQKKGKKGKDGKKTKESKENQDYPALWPLIRQVVVKCRSTALSTGAILVDLPGVADANAARNNICKDYMKKYLLGDAFKIQLKMDGNYDDSAITFIATKADDISCSEVIRALKLGDDEEIEALEEKIDEIMKDQKKWERGKVAAERAVKVTEKQLKEVCVRADKCRGHLKAVKNGESFRPNLAADKYQSPSGQLGKRKRTGQGKKRSPKRIKSELDDEGSVADIDETHLDDGDVEDTSEASDSDSASSNEEDSTCSDPDDEQEEADAMNGEDEVTEESLNAWIEEATNSIGTLQTKFKSEMTELERAADGMVNTTDRLAKLQTEKNGICSLKRSEFSCDVLKEDFRMGLKEIDEAEVQECDPDAFDPTQQIRDYENVDLRTFCVSARDYIRIKKQVKGDGEPTCFTKPEATGIPALQEWCQTLTASSRQRAARNFLIHLRTFIASAHSYLREITEVREAARKALREQWKSVSEQEPQDDGDDDGAFDRKKPKKNQVDIHGGLIGVMPRLTKEFELVIDNAVGELKNRFGEGLNDKLKAGASQAAASAPSTSDEFAASMHWGTYRATLRRHGSYRRCLNAELIAPLTKNIASSWAKVFEGDLFASFEARAMQPINELLKDIENAAAPELEDHAKQQGEAALAEAKVALNSLVTLVGDILQDQQKNISRCLVPHVQAQLRSGYHEAMMERGRGSVARQKAVFHRYICTRDHVFSGGAETLLQLLDTAADAIGDALGTALWDLAQKIEVNMSVLWETPCHDPSQVRARRKALDSLKAVDEQVALWTEAERIDAQAGA